MTSMLAKATCRTMTYVNKHILRIFFSVFRNAFLFHIFPDDKFRGSDATTALLCLTYIKRTRHLQCYVGDKR